MIAACIVEIDDTRIAFQDVLAIRRVVVGDSLVFSGLEHESFVECDLSSLQFVLRESGHRRNQHRNVSLAALDHLVLWLWSHFHHLLLAGTQELWLRGFLLCGLAKNKQQKVGKAEESGIKKFDELSCMAYDYGLADGYVKNMI